MEVQKQIGLLGNNCSQRHFRSVGGSGWRREVLMRREDDGSLNGQNGANGVGGNRVAAA